MLPLVALSETAPLIIDQPEDNLDNRMIGETLTKILADLKERRQIIVTTHNPNIVVGGDAEQVVVLEPIGVHEAQVETTGSIDDSVIIENVVAIMEGGREAFRAVTVGIASRAEAPGSAAVNKPLSMTNTNRSLHRGTEPTEEVSNIVSRVPTSWLCTR